jgi:hypothetical protein
MSAISTQKITLTIANGQTSSQKLSTVLSAGQLKMMLGALVGLTVFAPAALTGSVNPVVMDTEGGTGLVLQLNGADVVCNVNKASFVPAGGWLDFQLVSSASETADRIFTIVAQLEIR